MAKSVDPDQTAPIGAVCSRPSLFASMLNLSLMLGNYLQQTTSADDIFRCIFFLALLGVILPINFVMKILSTFYDSWIYSNESNATFDHGCKHHEIISEYDQEIPQSQTVDQPTEP